MNWIDTGKVGLRYELSGQGPRQVVLIHELGGSLESWDDIAARLGGDHRVLRYDSRGAGMSQKIQGRLDIQDLVDDMRSLLSALDISGPVALAGCAIGSAVAICFAAQYPNLASGLIAMSPALGVAPEKREPMRSRVDELAKAGVRVFREEALAASYPEVIRALDRQRFAAYQARWLGNHITSFAATYRMLIDMEIGRQLPKVACPALVIGGALDQLRPPALCQEVAAHIPGARYQTLQSGHFMPYQTPDLVADAMLEFLRTLPPIS